MNYRIRTAERFPAPPSNLHQPGRPTIEEMTARYARMGLVGIKRRRTWDTHRPPLSESDKILINALRPTHTLQELGQMFDRHASSIAAICTVKVNLRSGRSGNWRRN
jgi:hypothetical protein